MRRLLLPIALVLGGPLAGTALAAPTAAITATPADGPAPLAVTLDASASTPDAGHAIAGVAWDLGDGTTAFGPVVQHVFAAGDHLATLTVTDDDGATATASVHVVAHGTTMRLTRGRLVYGQGLAATGTALPAVAGTRVVVERARLAGGWQGVGTAATAADGTWRLAFRPQLGGAYRARLADGPAPADAAIAGQDLQLLPRLTVTAGAGLAYLGAPLVVRAEPAAAEGARVRVTVSQGGKSVARLTGAIRHGALRLQVPTPGVGRFALDLDVAARPGLAGRTAHAQVAAAGRPLAYGSSGADVAAVVRRLAALRFHVPGPQATFDASITDAVIAFQKAYGLDRTGTVGDATWSELARAQVVRPRFRGPALHIEVDKTRQILLVVHGGKVTGILPVSTGATGNTPSGTFHILWKAPSTTTWLGSAILFRTMTYHGNFAIHGYPEVPAYAASHGCTRIPVWAADWLYRQSPVGEAVINY